MLEALNQRIWDSVNYQGRLKVRSAKAAVARAVRQEAGQIFKWVATQIGHELGSVPQALRPFQSGWANLSDKRVRGHKSYKQKKEWEYRNQAFFMGLPRDTIRHDSSLEDALDNLDPTTVFGLDIEEDDEEHHRHVNPLVSLSFRTLKESLTFKITARIYPNISPNATNADLAELVASAVGDPTIFYRIMNPRGVERPLLLPSLLYFTRVRVMRKVEDTLIDSGFNIRSGGNG